MSTTPRLKNQRILVTGAGGFIGSHLVETLVRAGARVRAFLRYTSTGFPGALLFVTPEILKEVERVYGDLRDPEAVARAMEGVDAVVHLGAVISIPYSYQNPREVVETNVLGTLNVLQAARNHGELQRIVQVSTSEVYGTARYIPMDEGHPRHAQSPYAASKIGADELARSFAHTYGLPVVILRPFNTFGPRQSARAVIMSTLLQALQGPEIRIGHQDPVRDFTYVEDTVAGLVQALVQPVSPGEEINLGTGQGVRIGDLVETLRRLTNSPYPVVSEAQRMRPRTSEVWQLVSNPQKAREILNWTPQVSLEEGLKRTIQWVKQTLETPEGRLWIAGSGAGWW